MARVSNTISQKLKNANVLFTILIVWLHVLANYDLPEFVSGCAIFSVPCFFAISSYLYFKSYDFENPWHDYKKKVIGRIRSLLVPFLIFNMVGFICSVVFFVFHPVAYNPVRALMEENCFEYVFMSKANGPLWYFVSLFCFIVVAPLLGFVIKVSKWSIVLVLPIYWLCKDVGYFYFPYWLVDIFIGAYIAIHALDVTERKVRKPIMGGLIIASIVALVLGALGIIDAYTTRALSPILFIVLYSKSDILPSKMVSLIAPYSILIYCLHLPISRIAIRIPMILHIPYPLLSLAISTIATIIIIIAIGKLIKKYPNVWNLVTGGR